MKEYQHYIFDLDLTLFDTRVGLDKCYEKSLGAIGRPYSSSQVAELAKESFELTRKRYDMNKQEFSTFVDKFESTSRYYMTRYAKLYSDVADTIKALKDNNKRLSIVTCKPRRSVQALLKKVGMTKTFSDIIGEGQYEKPKPSAEPILVCMSHTDIPRAESVYIGDSPNDIKSANAAGIDAYLISRDGGEAEGIIVSLNQLLVPIEISLPMSA